jgi:peptidoglycan hydrolase CwlO-like protein
MSTPTEAVADFLDRADSCYEEYEQGYTDADATLRKLDGHIEELRSAVEE